MKQEEIVSLVKDMFGVPEAAWVSGLRLTPSMLQKVVDHVIRSEREACDRAVDESSVCFTQDQAIIKQLALRAIRARREQP